MRSKLIYRLKKAFVFFILISLVFAGCKHNTRNGKADEKTTEITDMAGRKLILPSTVTRITSNGLPGSILLYTLAEELMIARNSDPSGAENSYCTPFYCSLPVIGSWFSTTGTRNTEEVIRLKPDVIISAGNIGGKAIEVTNRDQDLLKIPVMLVRTKLTDLPETYRLLGNLFNKEEKAEELMAFYRKYIPSILEKAAGFDSLNRKRVYMAMGGEGLFTAPASSLHGQVVEYAGGINIANVTMNNKEVAAHVNVSLEQVMSWNPDVILACGISDVSSQQVRDKILTDPRWQGISAIKKQQVYQVPSSPYLWLDRPPSINQVIGVIWLANLLYPEQFTYDIKEVVKEFYMKFYHHTLTDAEVVKVLEL